jgi:Ni,Fe-hydrogenase III small subunit/ferredoxin-like protein FixX
MSFWFWHGLRKGIQSTSYPKGAETAPGISPGRPIDTEFNATERAQLAVAICPVDAIRADGRTAIVDQGRCIHCQRCRLGISPAMAWETGFEWARLPEQQSEPAPLPSAFAKSMHIMVVDTGDCGACLHEVKQLNNPLYNIHRLGFFFTATPRTADLLLIVGPVTENMRGPLLKTWEAMPSTRRVLAVGSCAISGGVFGRSFICAGGARAVLPVDFEVPGNPPPPLAILHGLLAVAGRKSVMKTRPGSGKEVVN